MQLASFDILMYGRQSDGAPLQPTALPDFDMRPPGTIPFIIQMDTSAPRSASQYAYFHAYYFPNLKVIVISEDGYFHDGCGVGPQPIYAYALDPVQQAYLDETLTIRVPVPVSESRQSTGLTPPDNEQPDGYDYDKYQ